MSALDTQVGGSHYKSMPVQPAEFIYKNDIGYLEGAAIKYLCRHRGKGGVQDLEKAIHYIEILMEQEYGVIRGLTPANAPVTNSNHHA